MQALFSLAPSFIVSDPQDGQQIKKLITEIKSGCCGDLEQTSVEEEYNALYIAKDTTQLVRDAVIQEALMGCLENGAEATRRWILKNVIEVRIFLYFRNTSDSSIMRLGTLALAFTEQQNIFHASSFCHSCSQTYHFHPCQS